MIKPKLYIVLDEALKEGKLTQHEYIAVGAACEFGSNLTRDEALSLKFGTKWPSILKDLCADRIEGGK